MNTNEQSKFWQLYQDKARPRIERACSRVARSITDNAMDTDDLVSWVDRRVWKMLEHDSWPAFHDEPSADEAIERLIDHTNLLARWAYLSHSRAMWRRESQQREMVAELGRAERLAMTKRAGSGFEASESVKSDLDRLRRALDPALKQKIAASWHDKSERHRVALVLGATRDEDDQLIEQANDGSLKENTVQQMRSRARRRVSDIFDHLSKGSAVLLAVGLLGLLAATSPNAMAGEQSGGRKGMDAAAMSMPADVLAVDGEQSGGRGG